MFTSLNQFKWSLGLQWHNLKTGNSQSYNSTIRATFTALGLVSFSCNSSFWPSKETFFIHQVLSLAPRKPFTPILTISLLCPEVLSSMGSYTHFPGSLPSNHSLTACLLAPPPFISTETSEDSFFLDCHLILPAFSGPSNSWF